MPDPVVLTAVLSMELTVALTAPAGRPSTRFIAGQVIKGWDLSVATMRKGEKAVVTIQSGGCSCRLRGSGSAAAVGGALACQLWKGEKAVG